MATRQRFANLFGNYFFFLAGLPSTEKSFNKWYLHIEMSGINQARYIKPSQGIAGLHREPWISLWSRPRDYPSNEAGQEGSLLNNTSPGAKGAAALPADWGRLQLLTEQSSLLCCSESPPSPHRGSRSDSKSPLRKDIWGCNGTFSPLPLLLSPAQQAFLPHWTHWSLPAPSSRGDPGEVRAAPPHFQAHWAASLCNPQTLHVRAAYLFSLIGKLSWKAVGKEHSLGKAGFLLPSK